MEQCVFQATTLLRTGANFQGSILLVYIGIYWDSPDPFSPTGHGLRPPTLLSRGTLLLLLLVQDPWTFPAHPFSSLL